MHGIGSRTVVQPRHGRSQTAASSLLLALVIGFHSVAAPASQGGDDEHAAHHPEGKSAGGEEAGGPSGMGGGPGMESMMERMGVPPPRELYPEMMRVEDPIPERRRELLTAARERRLHGAARLERGLEDLDRASQTQDLDALMESIAEARTAFDELESGLATEQALQKGSEPRLVALHWFQDQMGIAGGEKLQPRGPFGLSWFHAFTMVLLSFFALTMVAMYFVKMRRAASLLRLLADPSRNGGSPGLVAPSPPVAAPVPLPLPRATEGTSNSASLFDALRKTGMCGGCKSPCATRVRVAQVVEEAPGVKTFRLAPLDDGPLPFDYLPGQFLNVVVPAGAGDGTATKRSYTIASSPTQAAFCEITVKRDPDGLVSRYLHDEVRQGSELKIAAPYGRFTFTGDEAESVALIGGGVGITPLMSVVRYLTDRSWSGSITLLYGFQTPADFVFRDELIRLESRHPNLLVVPVSNEDPVGDWTGRTGLINEALIRECVPDITSRRVHVCGPTPMMDAVRSLLLEIGVPKDSIRRESFGQPPPTSSEAADDEPQSDIHASVRFTRSERSAPLNPNQTILDVAESVGVEIDWSCRAGTCGSCAVKLLSGEVEMEVDEGLDEEDRRAGMVLACQARATADIEVEA